MAVLASEETVADPTIAFIDTSAQSAAPGYYHVFPNEPIPGTDSVMVTKTIALKNRLVDNLLEQIAANAKPGSNILIVSHGNDTGLFFNFGDKSLKLFCRRDSRNPTKI